MLVNLLFEENNILTGQKPVRSKELPVFAFVPVPWKHEKNSIGEAKTEQKQELTG